jgi:hypothetical protein
MSTDSNGGPEDMSAFVDYSIWTGDTINPYTQTPGFWVGDTITTPNSQGVNITTPPVKYTFVDNMTGLNSKISPSVLAQYASLATQFGVGILKKNYIVVEREDSSTEEISFAPKSILTELARNPDMIAELSEPVRRRIIAKLNALVKAAREEVQQEEAMSVSERRFRDIAQDVEDDSSDIRITPEPQDYLTPEGL